MIKEERFIDESTGEMMKKTTRFISSAFDEEKGYLFWVRKSFAKSFQDIDFPKEMTITDIGRMTVLSKHIWSNTNMLGYRGNGGVRPYNTDKIGRILGIKIRQTQRFIEKMIRLGVIKRVLVDGGGEKDTHFYINPIYFFSSNRIPLNLYLIFRKELDQHLPDWVKEKYAEEDRKREHA